MNSDKPFAFNRRSSVCIGGPLCFSLFPEPVRAAIARNSVDIFEDRATDWLPETMVSNYLSVRNLLII
jgi:hypothetical protein